MYLLVGRTWCAENGGCRCTKLSSTRIKMERQNLPRHNRPGVESSRNVMAHGDAREGKWRGNCRMEWVASTLHTTSEHGVSSITTADAHTSTASSRLNWGPRRFKWTRPFRRKTKSDLCACGIVFQTQSALCHGYADGEVWIPIMNSVLVSPVNSWPPNALQVNANIRHTISTLCMIVQSSGETDKYWPRESASSKNGVYIRTCHLTSKVKMGGRGGVPSPSRSGKFTFVAGQKK